MISLHEERSGFAKDVGGGNKYSDPAKQGPRSSRNGFPLCKLFRRENEKVRAGKQGAAKRRRPARKVTKVYLSYPPQGMMMLFGRRAKAPLKIPAPPRKRRNLY